MHRLFLWKWEKRSVMSQEKLSISVIICTYTEARWNNLVEAVSSLRKQTYAAEEILVVVDHNVALLQRVRTHLTDVVVVENTEIRGLSGARNSGITRAKGTLVAFLDDDAVATPNWLQLLHEASMQNDVVGVGGSVIADWQGHQPNWFPEEFLWVVGCTYRGMPQQGTTIRNLIGANMVFRKAIFHYIDGFRYEIGRVGTRPMGCEETELCIRIAHYWPDKRFLYEPKAAVVHRIAAKRATWGYFCSRCYAEGRSKATVTRFVGPHSGLASERTYVLSTLPQGVIRGVNSLRQRNMTGLLRAGAIVTGLFVTIAGYGVGSIFSQVSRPVEDNRIKEWGHIPTVGGVL